MRVLRHTGPGVTALLGVVALTACDHAVADTVGPLDAATLAEAATRVSPADMMADLGLEPGQQEQVVDGMEALHTAMLALHEAMPADMESMDQSEREALHRELEAQMKDVHERHNALMASLTEEQQQRFAEHVHARMKDDADHGATHVGSALPTGFTRRSRTAVTEPDQAAPPGRRVDSPGPGVAPRS